MKRQILALAILLTAGSWANAQENVTPTASDERQKFVCKMDLRDGMPDYEFHAIVDWDGEVAKGAGVLIAVKYGTRSYYTGQETPDVRRIVQRFNFEMVSEETPYEQYFKFKNNTADNKLLITWRQDFSDTVPVQHYLVLKGVKYKFLFCESQGSENHYVTPGFSSDRGWQ